MDKVELQKLLTEIYKLEPALKKQEADIIDLVERLIKAKPDTKFDKNFAITLKNHLLAKASETKEVKFGKTFNIFNFMESRHYAYIGVGVVVLVAAVTIVTWPKKSSDLEGLATAPFANKQEVVFAEGIKQTNPKAFGELMTTGAVGAQAKDLLSSTAKPTVGAAASGVAETAVTTGQANNVAVMSAPIAASEPATPKVQSTETARSVSVPVGAGGGSADVISSRMIAPMYSFNYVYKGEKLSLDKPQLTVYKRVKSSGAVATNLASKISGKDLGVIDLAKFSDLKLSNITLVEDKDLGLSITMDLENDNLYIGQNWQKWANPERDKCTDEACWNKFRMTIEQVLGDEEIVKIANQFLADKGIDLTHYAAPQVNNDWRKDYDKQKDKTNAYIPEQSEVIYPLVIDGQEVKDQSGNAVGLRVSVDHAKARVSSVGNIHAYYYEASLYDTETDFSRLTKIAEKGGWNYFYGYYGDKKINVEIGTPVVGLVETWDYSNVTAQILEVPALIFPVTKYPDNYYGPKFITVPLVKNLLTEMEKNGGVTGGGVIKY